jgi:lysophospholipid acyltransferase (LPLAT)-like uncharacterized protein
VSATSVTTDQPSNNPSYTLRQRLLLWVIGWIGFVLIRLIGPTLRYSTSFEEGAPKGDFVRPVIWLFWHECIITAAWHWRRREIAVMTSRSFDGEYIARIVEKFGYRTVRGSSTRGAVGALLGMRRELEQGRSVAFTIDGPQGPRHVAKPGPVLLARVSGRPLCAFHLAVNRAWVLPTWDRLVIPKPFSRVLLRFSRRIEVARDADAAEADRLHAEMQSALERARDFALAHSKLDENLSSAR